MPSSNVNHVVISGNLTKDPELRETSKGTSVCELRIANNASIKRGEEWEQKPNYFQVNTWGKQAENCAEYLAKGSKVIIDGRLEWQMWEAKEGGTNSRVVIVANMVEFVGARKEKSQPADPEANKSDPDIPF